MKGDIFTLNSLILIPGNDKPFCHNSLDKENAHNKKQQEKELDQVSINY